jgi:hypothetical protein
MSDIVWVAVIAAVPATVSALLGVRNSRKIEDLHLIVNSRLSELLMITRISSFAEGVKEQKDKERT